MDFDELLVKLGEFGKYQKQLYILLCIPGISCGIFMVISVFLMGEPIHRYVGANTHVLHVDYYYIYLYVCV